MVPDPKLLLDDQRQQVALPEDVEQALGVTGDDESDAPGRDALSHRDSSVAGDAAESDRVRPAMPKVRAQASGPTTAPTFARYSA